MKPSMPYSKSRRTPLFIRIEVKSEADSRLLADKLAEMAGEDDDLVFTPENDGDTFQLGGQGELHLDETIGALKAAGAAFEIGAPEITHLETITRAIKVDYTHKRLNHGRGEFARVVLDLIPTGHDSGFEFADSTPLDRIPKEFVPGVEKGLLSVVERGPLMGKPVVGVKAVLLDAAFHETDSSAIAFEIAARAAFRESARSRGWALLEPIMLVQATAPKETAGSVIGDLNRRRGTVVGTGKIDSLMTIEASVPLSNMFGYQSSLARLTFGTGSFSMKYSHYEAVTGPNDGPDNFPPAIGMRA
jgi:elongation factor G